MKKTLKLMLAGAFALLAFSACSDDEEPFVEPNTGSESEDAYYASLATISSSDSKFTKTDEGGDILFSLTGGTVTVNVNCGCEWNVTTAGTTGWLDVSATNSSVTFSASAIDTEENNVAKVVLATAIDGIKFATINVTQTGVAFVKLSKGTLAFPSTASSASVTVETNVDWDYSYDKSDNWFTLERDGNDLIVSTLDYDGDDNRESVVTVIAGSSAENNTAEAQLTIVQTGNALIITYSITAANTTTNLPLYGTVDCTVDWGDGNVETLTSTQPEHTYTAAGEYDVTVTGTVTALYSRYISSSSAALPITAVKQWGSTGLTDMQYAFYYCNKLVDLPKATGDAFAGVKSFNRMFYYCTAIADIPEDLFADCVEATDFKYAFYYCTAIEELPAGLFDNCLGAEEFSYTFYGCSGLKTLPDEGLFKNCTNVNTFYCIFYKCTGLETIPSGLFNNCTNVENFSFVFYGCTSLKSIPAGMADGLTKVTNASDIFYNCTSITEIPAGLFDSFVNVETFHAVFQGCTALKTIPAGLFDKCVNTTDFYAVFNQCRSLEEIPAGLFDNCPLVTDFQYAFSECESLKAIPKGLFDNCPLVTTFLCTFQTCRSIEEVPEGLFDNCPLVESFEILFYYCDSLKKIPTNLFDHNMLATDFYAAFQYCTAVEGESPYTEIEVNGETVKVHLYDRENYTSELGCAAPTYYTQCFSNSSFSDYDTIPSSWGGGGD